MARELGASTERFDFFRRCCERCRDAAGEMEHAEDHRRKHHEQGAKQ